MKPVVPALICLLALLWLPGCSTPVAIGDGGCNQSASPCLQTNARIALITDRGRVIVELDGKNAPLTAGNFLDLVKRGVYTNTVFHRVVNQPTPFVVQGGDPQSAKPGVSPNLFGTGNFLDPATGAPRFIPLEVKLSSEAIPRYGLPINGARVTDKLALPHHRGAIAMARSQDPNSASAQFYVALNDLPELDGRYAVFGKVIEGMPVIDRIMQGDRLRKAEVLQVGT
jgi:peptidyl-prolyl cis-trans isomerase B (cyclophilin B)